MLSLSPFPYYGGKNKMASFIAELIDYSSTEIYYEIFGGAGSVLLTKPRHAKEIYNDPSAGVSDFFRLMSRPDTAKELIYCINQTEYSKEAFEEAREYRDWIEDNYLERYIKIVKQTINYIKRKYTGLDMSNYVECLYNDIGAEKKDNEKKSKLVDKDIKNIKLDDLLCQLRKIYEQVNKDDKSKLHKIIEPLEEYRKRLKEVSRGYRNRGYTKEEANSRALWDCSNDVVDYDIYKLATATYIVYSQSRDGMGSVFSETKNYFGGMRKLYAIAERMEGVEVQRMYNSNFTWTRRIADNFYQGIGEVDPGELLRELEKEYQGAELDKAIKVYNNLLMEKARLLKYDWLYNDRVMVYLDPPYLSTEDNEDLGIAYKSSMSPEVHREMLEVMQNAKCKMIISNYENSIYDEMLEGWRKVYYETTTSIGGKKNNIRTEVLYLNY